MQVAVHGLVKARAGILEGTHDTYHGKYGGEWVRRIWCKRDVTDRRFIDNGMYCPKVIVPCKINEVVVCFDLLAPYLGSSSG